MTSNNIDKVSMAIRWCCECKGYRQHVHIGICPNHAPPEGVDLIKYVDVAHWLELTPSQFRHMYLSYKLKNDPEVEIAALQRYRDKRNKVGFSKQAIVELVKELKEKGCTLYELMNPKPSDILLRREDVAGELGISADVLSHLRAREIWPYRLLKATLYMGQHFYDPKSLSLVKEVLAQSLEHFCETYGRNQE